MAENKIPYKIYLDESEIPTKWYNVRADMKNKPAPAFKPCNTQAYDTRRPCSRVL